MDLTQHSLKILKLKPGAGKAEIKRAFKELAFEYHPDRQRHTDGGEEKFKEVAQAYAYLMGHQEAYETLSKNSDSSFSASDSQVDDIYKTLFDLETRSQARRYQELPIALNLSLEEAFQGGSKIFRLKRRDLCTSCQGEGVARGAKRRTCTYCFGEAVVGNKKQACPACGGKGFLSSETCLNCQGEGAVLKESKVKITWPSRWNPKNVLEISEMGHEYDTGLRGPVKVSLVPQEHESFSFDGENILCEVEISMSQAALGGEVEVPTLQGPKKVSLAPGVQSGSIFRLKAYGLGGDQLIRWQVTTLAALSERERRFFQTLLGKGKEGLWQKIKRYLW
ncbi:MAG: J domain-containing protein [Deltaproteobacteria bacterium]|nr:J domain-containing protein [Deltaproteobacteria bacterium]